jgi:adenosine deaminase
MAPTVDAAAMRALPKAELHQHLDGSVRPPTAVELATDAGRSLDLDEARRRMVGPERCGSQAELLTFFDLPIALLQTDAALRRAAAELVEDLADDGVRYAEIRWAPRLHLDGGLSVEAVIDAVSQGVAQGTASVPEARRPVIGLIVTAMRSHPPGANVLLARAASAFAPVVVGFDLAGPEAEFPAPPHAAAFRAAEEGGLALTAHAGEVAGSERVREVLAFGVSRVAHGVTAADDPDLLDELRRTDVTLDLCPTSNVQAGIVPSLDAHPIARLHREEVSVTLSTDDRTVTGLTLSQEYARVAAALDMPPDALAGIALNGFRRAFAPPAVMRPLLREAEAAWGAWAAAIS